MLTSTLALFLSLQHPMGAALTAAPSTDIPIQYRGAKIGGPVHHIAGKKVALTFDDGPCPGRTQKVLALLRQYRAKATFFLVGSNVDAHPALVRQIVSEGHAIGSHSYTHPSNTTPASAERELSRTREAIRRAVGFAPVLFRPPYGIFKGTLGKLARKQGYTTILWSTDTNDWRTHDSGLIARRASRSVGRGSIVLMHDIHAQTVRAVPQILKTLQERGIECVTVPELLREEAATVGKPPTVAVGTPPAAPVGTPRAANRPSGRRAR